jgi:hypothetical protein
LREELHDRVKEQLGAEAYERHFGHTPFARAGGPRGTTARLRAWIDALAESVNSGRCPPSLVALTLLFFGAPPPTDMTFSAEAAGSPVVLDAISAVPLADDEHFASLVDGGYCGYGLEEADGDCQSDFSADERQFADFGMGFGTEGDTGGSGCGEPGVVERKHGHR